MANVTAEGLEELVVETLASFGPEKEQITRSASIEELDLDSLDVVELAQVLEDELGIEIKPERYEGSKTIGDLLDRTLEIARTS